MIEDRARIEFAHASDAEEIALISKNDIEYGLGWKYTPERIIRFIEDHSKNVVVARVAAELAGFGIMTYYQEQANLDLLAVQSRFRRRKIGTQLVQWLEKVALTAGAFNVFVQVRADNVDAIAFYQELGYYEIEQHKGYYQGIETGTIMARNLRPMFRIT